MTETIEKIYALSLEFIHRKQWNAEQIKNTCLVKKEALLALDETNICEFIIKNIHDRMQCIHDTIFEEFKNQCLPDRLNDITNSELVKIKEVILESCNNKYMKSAISLFFVCDVLAFLAVNRAVKGIVIGQKSTPLVYQMH